MLDYLRNLRANFRRQVKPVVPARRATSRPTHDTSVLPIITETSQAVVLRPSESPLRPRPEESDCLLPSLSAHVYQSIDSENGEIRLLEVLPGCYDDVIKIKLYAKNLNDKPTYEALSYAWGTIPSSNRAIINGCPVPVRESLDLALRRLRNPYQSRILWIDALCINQSDTRERSHQVQHMATIYKSATGVVIWLGEWQALDDCSGFTNSSECQTTWIRDLNRSINVMLDRTPQFLHLCQHALEISKLPWFRRLWIIQELLLASSQPKFILGDCVMNSTDLFPAMNGGLTVLSQDEYSYMLKREPTTPGLGILLRSLITQAIGPNQSFPHLLMLQKMLKSFLESGGASLYEYSVLSRYAMATDSRDRIYGLLGIVKSYVAEPIVPDYSKAWPQVLAEATIVMISEDGQFPYMSDEFAFPSADRPQEGYHTPSWVLDFSQSISGDASIDFPGYSIDRLSSEVIERRRKSLRLSDDSRTLYKHGRYIGSITRTYFFTPEDSSRSLSEIAMESAAGVYDFYHEALKPRGITPDLLYEALIKRHHFGFSVEEFTSTLLGHRGDFLLSFRDDSPSGHPFSIFLTDKGYVGYTWLDRNSDIRVDDILVALFELRMPFILRPVEGGFTYRMVNLAYISEYSGEYSQFYQLCGFASYRPHEDPRDWVYDEAEGCSEYAIV
ncbi:unnamed protein product [Alternaria alternata]